MNIVPYLNLSGKAEEAINFYQEKLGAKVVMLMRFKDMPQQEGTSGEAESNEDQQNCQMPPEMLEKIMHATLTLGSSTVMMSDSPEPGEPEFKGFTLSIATDDMEEATSMFNALAEEGEVKTPLEATFWAKAFGMVDDKFGVSWMVNVADPEVTE